jgi:Condensation domain
MIQAEFDNAGERTANQHETTVWGTHEGFFLVIAFAKPLDIDSMRCAIDEIVQRHGALRTSFSLSEEGKLKQTIHPALEFETEVVDLSSEVDPRQKAYEISQAAHRNPNFLLDRLPLLKFTIFDLGNEEWAFNLIFHHMYLFFPLSPRLNLTAYNSIMDEKSLATIFYELFTLYFRGFDSLPPPKLHYSDFSDWLLRTSGSHDRLRNHQLEFWAESLKDVPTLRLTLVTPSSELLSPITHIETVIDPHTLERYHALLKEVGVTPFSGFFAVYNVLLFKYSSQASFVVGTPAMQPSLSKLANVVGFFTNILPVKTNIDVDQTFSQYLDAFKADLMKSFGNGDVAYEEILSQDKDRSPFGGYFAHVFKFGGMNLSGIEQVMNAAQELTSDDIQVQSITPLPNIGHQYEVHLTVHNETGHVALQFDNHLLSEESARLLLNGYATLVGNLGRDPHIKISDASATTNQYDGLGI